jgi:hypothetical protein
MEIYLFGYKDIIEKDNSSYSWQILSLYVLSLYTFCRYTFYLFICFFVIICFASLYLLSSNVLSLYVFPLYTFCHYMFCHRIVRNCPLYNAVASTNFLQHYECRLKSFANFHLSVVGTAHGPASLSYLPGHH